jgi:NAD-dependent SIR2 family protein deacetylase
MAHFRCTPCRARVWRDGGVAEHAGDLCPACGGPLEPVERAEELVGLRALRPRPPAGRTIADHVRGVIAFHDAARAASAQRGGRDDLI